MRLSNFRYTLPKTRIADHPVEPRDSCKMMVLNRRKKEIEHKTFEDIASYFKKGDLLILNNSKVFPAKIFGQKEKTDAKIEVFLLRVLNREAGLWDVLVDPARKVRVGNKIYFEEDVVAKWSTIPPHAVAPSGSSIPKPMCSAWSTESAMFPSPYFTRKSKEADKENYQTVYASQTGAVVAQWQGCISPCPHPENPETRRQDSSHYSSPKLSTFHAIEVEDVSKHKMDSEYFNIPTRPPWRSTRQKSKKNGRVIAVGTTTCRVLEANATVDGKIKFGQGWTDKFIYPPYQFKVTDALVTNFQQPETTLLMVVSAFAEHRFLMDSYKTALKSDYRFLAYGDAMFIH